MYLLSITKLLFYTPPLPPSPQIPRLSIPPASPARGPMSGGTMVTISGTQLDVGSNHSVTLVQSNCEILNIRWVELASSQVGGSGGWSLLAVRWVGQVGGAC